MARENTNMDSGFVLLAGLQDFTMWDYDHGLSGQILDFDKTCWPVKVVAAHDCFPPLIFLKIIQPLVNAMLDKRFRCRRVMHNVAESQLPDVLSSYGIQRYMLPTKLGGAVLLDQAKWIARRRAAELEDI